MYVKVNVESMREETHDIRSGRGRSDINDSEVNDPESTSGVTLIGDCLLTTTDGGKAGKRYSLKPGHIHPNDR